MSYLKTINRIAYNFGGVLEVQIARAADVLEWPELKGDTWYGNIEFKAGAGFVKWYTTANENVFRYRSRTTIEGTLYKGAFKVVVPSDRKEIEEMLHLASDDELIILYKNANGLIKIFGSPTFPVQLQVSHSTKRGFGSRNQYECSFYYDGPLNNFFYDGSVQTAPGTAPAIVRWADGTMISSLQPGQVLEVDSNFTHDFEIISQ